MCVSMSCRPGLWSRGLDLAAVDLEQVADAVGALRDTWMDADHDPVISTALAVFDVVSIHESIDAVGQLLGECRPVSRRCEAHLTVEREGGHPLAGLGRTG